MKLRSLDSWHNVAKRLHAARHIALFLDFDGTLAGFRSRPDEVRVDRAARRSLAVLSRSPRFRVWIISGRRQADVRSRVGVSGVRYLGLYGREDDAGLALSEATRNALASISACASVLLAGIPGIWIEAKEHALTVHHRDAPDDNAARARQLLNGVVAPFSHLIRLDSGNHVLEVVPHELGDKGTAVIRELAALPAGTLPVYLGDDQADEAAFAALPGGITVCVGGRRPSHARYRMAGVAQVRNFLHRLTKEIA